MKVYQKFNAIRNAYPRCFGFALLIGLPTIAFLVTTVLEHIIH